MAQKKITAKEFREAGYLQELNRQFLHPLGLALEVVINEDGSESFGQVWDCRDDPEGLIYEPNLLINHLDNARRIHYESVEKAQSRRTLMGYVVQPLAAYENNLRWRWGSGTDGEDAADQFCLDCGGEVYSFKEGRICSKCNKTED